MKHFVSMTDTLKGVLKGDVEIQDLDGATFHFGCARSHIESGVPHEATWCNTQLPVIYGSDQLNAPIDPASSTLALEAVDEGLREKVAEFLSCVRAADAAGRVNYRIGNYQQYRAQLALAFGGNGTDTIYSNGEYSEFAHDHDAEIDF